MKLKIKNDWEYLTYTFGKYPINEKVGGTAILKDGQKVRYRSVPTNTTVHDMGHEYSITIYHLVAKVNIGKQFADVDLSTIHIKAISPDLPKLTKKK